MSPFGLSRGFNMLADVSTTGDQAMIGGVLSFAKSFGASIAYCLLGLVMFAIAYKVLGMILPFSIRKELEEDQNTALGIVLGCMMLGLAIIIAAAIHG